MSSKKYNKSLLGPIISESKSLRQVLHKLGLKQTGGNHTYLKKIIKELGINTSHFLGKAINRGKTSTQKKHWKEILCKRSPDSPRKEAAQLRRALKEFGREYKCVECKNTGVWNNKPLTLHVHHKDGAGHNNTPKNLEFICPNCHSQTENFGCKSKNETKCVTCKKPTKGSKQCVKCRMTGENNPAKSQPTKIDWPTPKEMQAMIINMSFVVIGKNLGVSDKSVAKFCKKHGLKRAGRGT